MNKKDEPLQNLPSWDLLPGNIVLKRRPPRPLIEDEDEDDDGEEEEDGE